MAGPAGEWRGNLRAAGHRSPQFLHTAWLAATADPDRSGPVDVKCAVIVSTPKRSQLFDSYPLARWGGIRCSPGADPVPRNRFQSKGKFQLFFSLFFRNPLAWVAAASMIIHGIWTRRSRVESSACLGGMRGNCGFGGDTRAPWGECGVCSAFLVSFLAVFRQVAVCALGARHSRVGYLFVSTLIVSAGGARSGLSWTV